MDLILTQTKAGTVSIITIDGDVDVASAAQLGEALDAHLAAGRKRLVLDLDGVPFMDSSGLGVLVGALRRARSLGGSVHLACTRSRIERIIDITGLDQVFCMHENVDDAVRACRSAEVDRESVPAAVR